MSASQILTAITPTPEQLMNWQFFSTLILAIAATFAALVWVLDRGIDHAVTYWNRRQGATVIPFEERRQELRRAMGLR